MINLMIANVLLTMAQIDHLIYFSRYEAPYVKRMFKRGVFNILVGFVATIIVVKTKSIVIGNLKIS